MQSYVVGFLFDDFDENDKLVTLIKKNRPSWQAGLWNGIGGKVEPGETNYQAMVREFAEETGVQTYESDWQLYSVVRGNGKDYDATGKDIDGWEVSYFYAFNAGYQTRVRKMTDEIPVSFPTSALPAMVHHNSWMIPMALARPKHLLLITELL